LITGTRECDAKRSMISCSNHHEVDHPRNDLAGVLHRLAASQLGVARVEVDRRAAELVHACLERKSGAGRAFLEDHRQRAIDQRVVRLIALEAALDQARAFEQVLQFVAREVLELQKVLEHHHAACCR
jgi:hypothetical protein